MQKWYYEKFRVHQLDSSISYESRLRPMIQNWSEEKAKKVDSIIQNNYVGVGEVNVNTLPGLCNIYIF